MKLSGSEVKKRIRALGCRKQSFAKIMGISPSYLSAFFRGARELPEGTVRAMELVIHHLYALRAECNQIHPLDMNNHVWLRAKIREIDRTIGLAERRKNRRPFRPLTVDCAKSA